MVARSWIGEMADPEQGLPALAERMLPAWGQGFVLAAIIAAVCSTADSQILAVTAAVGEDVLGLNGLASGTPGQSSGARWRRLLSTRVVFLFVCFCALIFALTKVRVVFTFVLYAWGVLGAGLGPVVIAVAFGRYISPWRAVLAMLVGAGTLVVWQSVPILSGNLYELVPAFCLGMATTWLLSRKACACRPEGGCRKSDDE
jgi:sodium/proline symporter